ncbi:DUF6959 family protein [Tabrizicola sp.]|uniref:DUF6959 family protein n=1 Tax=Tabrizicola sp. TaxID=2005166 RepID=UPI003F2C7003
MRREIVEIYSDHTNAAILRHPGRKFPGVLLQGDTLHALCQDIDNVLEKLDRSSSVYQGLNEIRNSLWNFKSHYKSVLVEHNLPIPFSEG